MFFYLVKIGDKSRKEKRKNTFLIALYVLLDSTFMGRLTSQKKRGKL